MATFKLALDAGHGMDTSGRRCLKSLDPEEHREWWLNDRVCRYIAQAAAEYEGFEILRVDDVTGREDVTMSERCRRANSWGADLYYSAHHNAGVGGGTGGGVVAYSLNEGTRGAMWRDDLYGAIVGETGLVGNRASPKATANFHVLRNTAMPAVLMEHGFMDSAADVPVILSEEYAKGVGRAVADTPVVLVVVKLDDVPLREAAGRAAGAGKRAGGDQYEQGRNPGHRQGGGSGGRPGGSGSPLHPPGGCDQEQLPPGAG